MQVKTMLGLICSVLIISNCNKKSDDAGTSTTSSTAIADGVAVIAKNVGVVGTGLGGGVSAASMSFEKNSISTMSVTPLVSSDCTSQGQPNGVSESDGKYPYLATYCALTVESGDTARGGFALVRSLICSLEKGGIQFSGASQTITANFTDTECWPNGGPEDGVSSLPLTAVNLDDDKAF